MRLYYQYTGNNYTGNHEVTITNASFANNWSAKTQTVGTKINGSTDDATPLPPYQNLYAWRRTA